jgi:putative peptidoglycan binding protein
MAEEYRVKQGDCISSIAFEKGFFSDTIWNHPNNSELKNKRKDPNILMPGDNVHIPDKRIREYSESTNQVYKYKCKNTPEKLRLQLLKENEPRANEQYELQIDSLKFSGSTDGQGRIEQSIPPNAKQGKLLLTNTEEIFQLSLGYLNPNDEVTGAQGRLRHLGFYFGPIDGKISPEMEHAIQEFQIYKDIEPNGELDANTQNALKESYGS